MQYGLWITVGDPFRYRSNRELYQLVRCKCRKQSVVRLRDLKSGESRSCGCRKGGGGTTHGLSSTPTYIAWRNMRHQHRGPVCPRWEAGFEQFWKDMGERPPNTRLVRPNRDRPWGPGNAVWKPIAGART